MAAKLRPKAMKVFGTFKNRKNKKKKEKKAGFSKLEENADKKKTLAVKAIDILLQSCVRRLFPLDVHSTPFTSFQKHFKKTEHFNALLNELNP